MLRIAYGSVHPYLHPIEAAKRWNRAQLTVREKLDQCIFP
jgi:hypothetical protein